MNAQPATLNAQLFSSQRGGLGKAVDLFGGQSRLAGLLDELNEVLAA